MNKKIRDKNIIICVTHLCLPAIEMYFNNLLPIIKNRKDIEMFVIDSGSKQAIVDYLKKIDLSNIEVIFHKENIGKAHAVNQFIKERINKDNLPRTIISIDPDILITEKDLDYLIEARENLDMVGMLSMRYIKNGFAPEQNIWFPAVKKKGKNNEVYKLRIPFLCNVAGGVFAIKGEMLHSVLKGIFYPINYTSAYGPDDAMLSDALRRAGYQNCYLEGTSALHLRSADRKAKELIEYEKNRSDS